MRRSSGLWTVLLACASCGLPTDGAGVVLPESPPLDALSLRDALLADPSVVAAVPAALRRRLGERFEQARRQPSTPVREILPAAGEAPALLHALDRGRQDRGQDALIVGALTETPVGVEAAAIPDDFPAIPSEPPFPLDIPEGAPSAALERCGLSGRALSTLQGLARDEAVSRVRRVVSWPVAAARIERTLYVNAAWLAAMCDDAGDKEPEREVPAPAAPRAASAAPAGGAGAQGCAGGAGSAGSSAPVPILGLLPADQVAPRTAEDDGSSPEPDRAAGPPRVTTDTGARTDGTDATDPRSRARRGGSEADDYVLYTLAHEGIGGDDGTPGSPTTGGPLNAASGGFGCGGSSCSSSSCSSSSNSCSSSSSSCSSGSDSCSSGSGCSSGSSGSGCSSGSSGGSCSSGTSGNGCTGVGSSCDTPNPTCQTQDDPCDPSREPHDPNRDCCRLCAVAPLRRSYDNIPGAVTLGFVLAPLALLSLLGRTPRRARAGRGE